VPVSTNISTNISTNPTPPPTPTPPAPPAPPAPPTCDPTLKVCQNNNDCNYPYGTCTWTSACASSCNCQPSWSGDNCTTCNEDDACGNSGDCVDGQCKCKGGRGVSGPSGSYVLGWTGAGCCKLQIGVGEQSSRYSTGNYDESPACPACTPPTLGYSKMKVINCDRRLCGHGTATLDGGGEGVRVQHGLDRFRM